MKTSLFSIFLLTGMLSFAQYTQIPDVNFEQALIDLGHDNVLDGQVLTASIENVASLQLANKGIQELTGIEDFRRLETLFCGNNNLQELDLSSNTNISWAIVNNNNLNSLNVNECDKLLLLDCSNNNLSNIDLTQNINLRTLNINRNQLTSLDLSQNSLLFTLLCNTNQIQNLDVTNSILLDLLDCGNNNLASLDLINNVNLRLFWV